MKFIACAVAAAALLLMVRSPADARMPSRIFCWSPDYEFPIGCDDEDDDDGSRSRAGRPLLQSLP